MTPDTTTDKGVANQNAETTTEEEAGNQSAELSNSPQKEIQEIRDRIQAMKEEAAAHGQDSLHEVLKDANSKLAEAWQIAGLDDEKLGEIENDVLIFLEENGRSRSDEIKEAMTNLGYSEYDASDALHRLRKKGKVERITDPEDNPTNKYEVVRNDR